MLAGAKLSVEKVKLVYFWIVKYTFLWLNGQKKTQTTKIKTISRKLF